MNYLFVMAGGAIGSAARYFAGQQAGRLLGTGWPYGTFAVNLIGGLLMGVLVAVLAQKGGADQERWRALLGVGVLGGFTTFSAFSLETALMIERRDYAVALTYVVASATLSIAAVFAGLMLTRKVLA
ncbi:fluoride efflux transporter CrcB [Caulobacter sp. NIBR2454]|uniref:fluoride efflux transporter CrcB n=1 Tax=Caulobacter sp. NIBR2454 TaxID=3015996 RepID=UPI0022B6BB8E|nr:fluoride efflux transporter CrcB [Caulobacter sp. NIBR2454]